MTPKERMLAAYRNKMPDKVPVSPEIWDATAIAVAGRPFHELIGPFAEVPWWQTHLRAFEFFGADAWIVPGIGDAPAQKEMLKAKSRFIDKHTIETELTYRTPQGELHAAAHTTEVYANWLYEHPVKNYPQDMDPFGAYFFADPLHGDLAEIRDALQGVGEKGLVTPMIGELFTSFLATYREGGIAQTIYDLCDYPDETRRFQEQFIAYMQQRTRLVLEKTKAEAVFINSGYAAPPMISPQLYREWDVPVLKAVGSVCREFNAPLHVHQHGHLLVIIEDLIAAGVNIVCPLLAPPQGDIADLKFLKSKYGHKIALKGNIDPIAVLQKKTPAEIEKEVKDCIKAAAPGGGFILGTADSVVIGTPFENIRAFVEAGRKYGCYPLARMLFPG